MKDDEPHCLQVDTEVPMIYLIWGNNIVSALRDDAGDLDFPGRSPLQRRFMAIRLQYWADQIQRSL